MIENGIKDYSYMLGKPPRRKIMVGTNAELAVVLDSLLVVLLNVVGEVVHGYIVIFDVLHDLNDRTLRHVKGEELDMAYPLLEATELARSQRISLANDGDDINARRQTAHELDIHLAQAVRYCEYLTSIYVEDITYA